MSDETPVWLQGSPTATRNLEQPEICLSPTETKTRIPSARRKLGALNLQDDKDMNEPESSSSPPPVQSLRAGGRPAPLPGREGPLPPLGPAGNVPNLPVVESRVDPLLQSWASLDFFKANQKGALGKEPLPDEMEEPHIVEDPAFEIPVLPTGRQLVIDIKSTWGMGHYVGLTGLEILDQTGSLVKLNDVYQQVFACPGSINELPQFQGLNDVRTIDKLFNGENNTCDDLNMWLAPFTSGESHTITVNFNGPTTVSCIRVWNYNKSRIHASRGARYVEMHLDNQKIFAGEIGQAPGTTVGSEECCEILVFTDDDPLLEAIDGYFIRAADSANRAEEAEAELAQLRMSMMLERPGTSHGKSSAPPTPIPASPVPTGPVGEGDRPFTAAGRDVTDEVGLRGMGPAADGGIIPSAATMGILGGRVLSIEPLSGWGTPCEAGLTGLQVLNSKKEPLKAWTDFAITVEFGLGALPETPDTAAKGQPSHRSARQPISKGALDAMAATLVDDVNQTTDPRHMAVLPPDTKTGGWARIMITCRQEADVAHLKLWNYNDGVEGSWRGCKRVSVNLDNTPIASGLLLRKAPGSECFDYGQMIDLKPATPVKTAGSNASNLPRPERKHMQLRDIETPNPYGAAARAGATSTTKSNLTTIEESIGFTTPRLPSGLIFKVLFHSTHGDPHYVGLNGLELYDENDCLIELTKQNVAADPESINVLPSVQKKGGDARSLDKLYDGVNDTYDDRHMWLAPLRADGTPNSLFLYFDNPITISHVKVWNYSKTTARGAAECSFYLDDVLIFRGELRPAPAKGEAQGGAFLDISQTILFTDDPELSVRESKRVHIPGDLRLSLINNNVEMKPETPSHVGGMDMRPMTQIGSAR
mmetsp:Transcript_13961/g.16857  ORF Transcript_13961/g.16857 Transcript_13961/m.16857 type:complete len:874 (-) Transcript_13961:312-2933(-)|eukprot:CAMPEP_0197862310 /NCGR_PEP_ID=MMETSP1438-20131217/38978_1 /TAXON_ID=1461541 /ORGANISM="Pterosperma sp., Strain CCMP1384" /LENGTH=873 /DNA_ID=CAMNT_0043479833 /DNA_START=204 /DNA_END=2825 /DNA_ORIENTATION=+